MSEGDLYTAGLPGQVVAGEEVEETDDEDDFLSPGTPSAPSIAPNVPKPLVTPSSNTCPVQSLAAGSDTVRPPSTSSSFSNVSHNDAASYSMVSRGEREPGEGREEDTEEEDVVLELDAAVLAGSLGDGAQAHARGRTPPLELPIDDSVDFPSVSDDESAGHILSFSVANINGKMKGGLEDLLKTTKKVFEDLNNPQGPPIHAVPGEAWNRIPAGVRAPHWTKQGELALHNSELGMALQNKLAKPFVTARKDVVTSINSAQRTINSVQTTSQHLRVLTDNLAMLNQTILSSLTSSHPKSPEPSKD